MNLTLPTSKELAEYVTWTGFSIRQLVDTGRIEPHKAAEDSIIRLQQEAINAGNLPPLDQIDKVALAYEKLECELLDLLLEA